MAPQKVHNANGLLLSVNWSPTAPFWKGGRESKSFMASGKDGPNRRFSETSCAVLGIYPTSSNFLVSIWQMSIAGSVDIVGTIDVTITNPIVVGR